jgi:hypothetical protein
VKYRSKPSFLVALILFLFLLAAGAYFAVTAANAEEPTAGSADKEVAAANFAARRTTLIKMMPWEMRSDLNYLALAADKGLMGQGGDKALDDLGADFTRLLRQCLEIYTEITKAEKTKMSQEELDKLTEERLVTFNKEAGELKGQLNLVLKRLAMTGKSQRWSFANNELFTPRTMATLNLLSELADAGALNQVTLAKLDADLTRLYELHMSMNEHATESETAARAAAHEKLRDQLEQDIAQVYQNLPASPRWKEWEKAAKK